MDKVMQNLMRNIVSFRNSSRSEIILKKPKIAILKNLVYLLYFNCIKNPFPHA